MTIKTHEASELKELDNLSKRLKYIIETHGIKQTHMASKIGLSPPALHYILNKEAEPTPSIAKKIDKIADLLQVNSSWLKTGEGEIYSSPPPPVRMVPVYTPEQLQGYGQNKKELKPSHYCPVLGSYSSALFGFIVTDNALSPKLEVGDQVVIEKTLAFKNSQIVLALIAQSKELVLRLAFREHKGIVLTDFSQNRQPLNLEAGDSIIGCYRECHKVASA